MSGIYADPNTKYVGIGTTAPLQKLHLVGDALVSGNVIPGACNVYNLGSADSRWKDLYLSGNTIDLGGTFLKRDEESGGIKIQSESGESVDTNVRNLNASGYVDINGTRLARHVSGPLMVTKSDGEMESGIFKHVYVDGTVRASNMEIIGDFVRLNTVTSNTEQMVIENAGTGPALKVTQTGENSIAEFYDDGNVLALKIADGGNVGIGTTLPLAKLNVYNGNNANSSGQPSSGFLATIYQADNTPSKGGLLVKNNWAAEGTSVVDFGNDFVGGPYASYYRISGVGTHVFGGNTNGARTENMRITMNGDVGIGSTNPIAKLHVQGTLYAPGCVVQRVVAAFNTSFALTTFHSEVAIRNPIISITPKFASSLITLEITFAGYHALNDYYTSLFIRRNNIGYANRISSSISEFYTAGNSSTQWGDWSYNFNAFNAIGAHAQYGFIGWDYPNSSTTVNYILSGYNHQSGRTFTLWSPVGTRIIATEIAV